MTKSARPFSAFEWMVAARYLRPKRTEGFVSVISILSLVGIALGVAVLIVVMSVMNGFQAQLLDRILGLQGHMIVQSYTGQLTDFDAIAGRVRALDGVEGAYPLAEGQVLVSTPNTSVGAVVWGLRASDLMALTAVSSTLSPGAMDSYDDGLSIILGRGLADGLGLASGDTVTLTAPRGAVTPFGMTPRQKTYRISGTFQIGMSEYDRTFIFMPLAEAQLFFGLGDAVHGIEIVVADPARVRDWRLPVSQAAGELARVSDWQQRNASLFSALEVERVTMFMILAMVILVAALNIISGLIMLVKDKGQDIAIMRTMGATKGAMMRVFFIAGSSIGVAGTIAGLVLAGLFLINIEAVRQFLARLLGVQLFDPAVYYLSQLPSRTEASDVIAVVTISLVLSFLATLYPSWRAARLDPVEALRYE